MSELNSASVNVLLADDHSLIRQGIVFLLEDMDWECEIFQASSLQQLMNSIQEHPIDIAIIDAHFPDGNSITIVPEIKKISPKPRSLFLQELKKAPIL